MRVPGPVSNCTADAGSSATLCNSTSFAKRAPALQLYGRYKTHCISFDQLRFPGVHRLQPAAQQCCNILGSAQTLADARCSTHFVVVHEPKQVCLHAIPSPKPEVACAPRCSYNV